MDHLTRSVPQARLSLACGPGGRPVRRPWRSWPPAAWALFAGDLLRCTTAVVVRGAPRRWSCAWRTVLAWVLFAVSFSSLAAERTSDPDGCLSCHGLPGLEYINKDGVRRVASILRADYYGSLHGSVSCKDCHRKIERYPHKAEEGYVDCSESCHVEEPSKGKPFTHKAVVDEFKTSAHGSGHAPGATKDFHGGNRLAEQVDGQNPSCRRCHSNTPYIKDRQMARFKEAFHHVDTECGTCHQGETWRNQFGGHILRRLVGNNYNKMESNALCVDCHGDGKAMAKVKIEDPKTKEKKPADFRFIHATDSYAKTLHGRLLAVNDEHGAACLDCHAPKGFRHGIQRDEQATASIHPDHLAETCSQSGCHGYARSGLDIGFTRTDVHDVDMLRLDFLPTMLAVTQMDTNWRRTLLLLGPLAALFALASLFWNFRSRENATAIVGHESFQRVMIGVKTAAKERWMGRFVARLAGPRAAGGLPDSARAEVDTRAAPTGMTLMYASQTGNGEGLAKEFAERAEASGYRVKLVDMAEFDPPAIVHERLLFIISSTHGEGEPPLAAAKLHAYLYGEDAPRLEHLKFAVFALGDCRYNRFCRTGKDFDAFLARLGATRVLDRVDADVDFEEPAATWFRDVLASYRSIVGEPEGSSVGRVEFDESMMATKIMYGKHNPYPAVVLTNININRADSAKETRHIEIDLEGSGLAYEPGDVLGVYPKNNPVYIEALLSALNMDGYAEITAGAEALTLREALFNRLDITGLSRVFVEKYANLIDSDALRALLAESAAERFNGYTWGRQILDLVEDYPADGISPQAFVNVLRRMPARLYSIASSLSAHPNQVHLTVGVVRYHAHGRDREGVCSTFLGNRVGTGDKLGIFVQVNKHFRLPKDPATPVIMVGPGSGIAPFRAFVQERQAMGASGRNWLFFGDQHRATDYLYGEEWEDKHRRGVLTRLDLAFSRDQADKVYVQTRMLESARDLYAWLDEGSSFYVCGDAARMARDVHEALIRVVAEQGGISREKAEEYLQAMAESGRYQRDVY